MPNESDRYVHHAPRKTDRPTDTVAPTPPLRVMFIITTLEVGGAETLLVNLVRRFDRRRVMPEICCLKAPGQLGDD